MKEGWLWLSILKTTAWPSPISTTPAFSPGPWMTWGPFVGSVFSHTFEDLYEQCSLHMTEKMPSSVKFGARPMMERMRAYSSDVRPWAAIASGGRVSGESIGGLGRNVSALCLARRGASTGEVAGHSR